MEPLRLHYSEDLVRRAVRAFWWRSTGPGYVVIVVVGALWLAGALARGEWSWRVGAAGALLALATGTSAALFFTHNRASLARLRRLATPAAVMELGDERLRLSSDVGVIEVRWDAVTEVWRFSDFWLLFFSRAQWVTLPTADLSDEARAHILARVPKQR